MADEKTKALWRAAILKMWEHPPLIDTKWAQTINRALKMAAEKSNG